MDVLRPTIVGSTSTGMGTSDESSCDDSTGPTTPDSSSIFYPSSLPEDIIRTPLSLCLKDSKSMNYNASKADVPALTVSTGPSPVAPTIRNICMIGAGYVGMYHRHNLSCLPLLCFFCSLNARTSSLTVSSRIGGPTAAVAALHNPSIRVEVLDKDPVRVGKWQTSHLPIHEPGLDNIIRIVRDGAYETGRADQKSKPSAETKASTRAPNLFFTTNSEDSISKADMIMLAVNTPTKMFGMGSGRATNMGIFDSALSDIAKYAKPGVIIVEKSTVPAGTAQRVRQIVSSGIQHGVPEACGDGHPRGCTNISIAWFAQTWHALRSALEPRVPVRGMCHREPITA